MPRIVERKLVQREVFSQASEHLRKPAISVGIRNFIEKYSPENALVVNSFLQGKTRHQETKLWFVYPREARSYLLFNLGRYKIRN